MNKKIIHMPVFAFIMVLLLMLLCGCRRNNTTEPSEMPEAISSTVEKVSDEQALCAVKNYCCINNPDLENIVKEEEYPVYWEISSSDENEIVVLFRSYTGAQNRYYINRTTGDTYVTEYVPQITMEEQRTDETFNIRDYL